MRSDPSHVSQAALDMKHWGYVGKRSCPVWTVALVGVLHKRQRVSYRRQNRPLSHGAKNKMAPPSFDKDASFSWQDKIDKFFIDVIPQIQGAKSLPMQPLPTWNSAEYHILQNIRCTNILEGKIWKVGGDFSHTRDGTLIVATIYLQLIQNRYMFRSFTVLHCSHQHRVQPVASDVEVVGYL